MNNNRILWGVWQVDAERPLRVGRVETVDWPNGGWDVVISHLMTPTRLQDRKS